MEDLTDQRPVFSIRLRAIAIAVAVVLAVFIGRLWLLQLTHWTAYAEWAVGNRTKIVWGEAERGLIYDRNGQVLAENEPVWNVEIVPADLPRDPERVEEIIAQLASILGPEKGTSTVEIRERIEKICAQTIVEAMPLEEIGENVSLRVVQAIEARQYEMPGVVIKDVLRRRYPRGALAALLIGFVRGITDLQLERVKDYYYPQSGAVANRLLNIPELSQERIYTASSQFGQEGVEASYEWRERNGKVLPVLQGRRGYHLYEVNAAGHPVREIESRPAEPGAAIYLSISSGFFPSTTV